MAGVNKHAPGCVCCECPVSLCALTVCADGMTQWPQTVVTGVDIDFKDSGGVSLGTCTTDNNGACCLSIAASPGETITGYASKAGYHSRTATGHLSCTSPLTLVFYLCPDDVDQTICAGLDYGGLGCRLGAGHALDLAGDVTDSGITGSDGCATFAIPLTQDGTPTSPWPPEACERLDDISVTLTPAANVLARTVTNTWGTGFPEPLRIQYCHAATPTIWTTCSELSSGYICGGSCLPLTLDYSDSSGSCTLSVGPLSDGRTGYSGAFTFTCTDTSILAKKATCYGSSVCRRSTTPRDITVAIEFWIDSTCATTGTAYLRRIITSPLVSISRNGDCTPVALQQCNVGLAGASGDVPPCFDFVLAGMRRPYSSGVGAVTSCGPGTFAAEVAYEMNPFGVNFFCTWHPLGSACLLGTATITGAW